MRKKKSIRVLHINIIIAIYFALRVSYYIVTGK